MKRLTLYIGYFTILVAHILIIGFCYLYLFDGRDAVEYQEMPYKTSKLVYHHDESITYRGIVCKNMLYPISAARVLYRVDSAAHVQTMIDLVTSGTTSLGCIHFTSFPAKIEDNIPDGTYRIQGTTFVQVNFLATRQFSWRTQDFQIVK